MDGLSVKGVLSDDRFPVISDAGILVNDGKIEAIGDFRELKSLNAGDRSCGRKLRRHARYDRCSYPFMLGRNEGKGLCNAVVR